MSSVRLRLHTTILMRAEEQAVLVNACSSKLPCLSRKPAFAIVRWMSRLVTLFRVRREIDGRSASTAVMIPEPSPKVRAWRSACQALDVLAQWLHRSHVHTAPSSSRRRVSEDLLDYLKRHASGCEHARRGVAKIVEAEAACDACDPFRAQKGASERNFRNVASSLVKTQWLTTCRARHSSRALLQNAEIGTTAHFFVFFIRRRMNPPSRSTCGG